MARKELRLIREQAGMTQTEVSKKAGVGLSSYQRMEHNPESLRGASYRNLYKIAQALGVNVWDIEMYDEQQADADEFDPITQP